MFDARRWLPVFRWNNWQTGGYSYRKVRSSKNLPDLSLFINVWVIDFGEDQNFWWFEGVIGRKVQCKFERAFIVGCLKIFYFSEKVNNCTSEGFNAPDQLRIDCSETARSLTLVSWISFEDWRSLYSFVSRFVPDILKLCLIFQCYFYGMYCELVSIRVGNSHGWTGSPRRALHLWRIRRQYNCCRLLLYRCVWSLTIKAFLRHYYGRFRCFVLLVRWEDDFFLLIFLQTEIVIEFHIFEISQKNHRFFLLWKFIGLYPRVAQLSSWFVHRI